MTLEDLLAEREVYRALVGVARAMDARDWEAMERLLLPDMTADLGTGPLQGSAAMIANIRSFLDECGPTQHLLGNVLIEVNGDSASSRVYVSDMHLGRGEKSQMTFSTLGDYHDQWRNVAGQWRMSHRTKHNRAHIGSFEVLGPGPAGWREA